MKNINGVSEITLHSYAWQLKLSLIIGQFMTFARKTSENIYYYTL